MRRSTTTQPNKAVHNNITKWDTVQQYSLIEHTQTPFLQKGDELCLKGRFAVDSDCAMSLIAKSVTHTGMKNLSDSDAEGPVKTCPFDFDTLIVSQTKNRKERIDSTSGTVVGLQGHFELRRRRWVQFVEAHFLQRSALYCRTHVRCARESGCRHWSHSLVQRCG